MKKNILEFKLANFGKHWLMKVGQRSEAMKLEHFIA